MCGVVGISPCFICMVGTFPVHQCFPQWGWTLRGLHLPFWGCFCPITANKMLFYAEISLLTLWLWKGRLIPVPFQSAFTNVPSKKERKQTPSIAWPPEGTGEPPKQEHFHQFFEQRHRRQPLVCSPGGKTAELPALALLISSCSLLNPARCSQ